MAGIMAMAMVGTGIPLSSGPTPVAAAGTISLTTLGSAYAENFDSLASTGTSSTVPNGWDFSEAGTNANTLYTAGTGSSNAGDTYSFGAAASTERAFGGLLSGSLVPTIGAWFANNTGSTFSAFTITYTGEMWRAGVSSRNAADRLDFQYSTDATSLTTGTWTDVDALDFSSPNISTTVGLLDGNLGANRSVISETVSSPAIVNGATFWIRWTDSNISSSDDGLAIDDFSLTPGDAAPTVTITTPADGASAVDPTTNLSVTFSEAVAASGTWFTIVCSVTGSHTASVSGGPTIFSLNPDTNFGDNESCIVRILAAQVTDQDTSDPPDNMAADFSWTFSMENVCTQSFTPIYTIQGSGPATPIPGTVTTQGVVVGDFEGTAAASGFYLQDLTGDTDAATSDGIFVLTGNADTVAAGQVVRVTGFARERFNQTTINGTNSNSSPVPAANILACGTGSVVATDVSLPFAAADFPERYEGMLVRLPQSLVISEYFNYDRFGEMVLALPLAGQDRAFTPTAVAEPGAPALAVALANSLSRITLDDAVSAQNPASNRHPNGSAFSLTNRFRGGDTVANAVGVLGFDFSLYRIFPTAAADYTATNPRPAAPNSVGGTLKVAAMNTLNYFLTLDYPTGNPLDNTCGPVQTLECRGADFDQPAEFSRQRAKLLAALAGLDADVIGLNEIENSPGVDPSGDIAAGLNDMFGAGTYAAISTGTIGTDAIKVGMIYRTATVTPVGVHKILDSSVDPRFIDTKSRPVLAQTFEEIATGGRITVAVNHLKSKGSACNDVGDLDAGDGQGNCNGTRTLAAQALVDWLATDPTGSGDRDYLIIGDLNSYAMEDPIDAIKAGPDGVAGNSDDYVNLIAKYLGPHAYSFVFDGQAGYLDHALASPTLVSQVTGATEWHINADEPDLLDYDTSFKAPSQDALYEPNGYRSSDHDPVLIGLNLTKRNVDGFLLPIANAPAMNTANAGSTVPLKFSLGGFQGFEFLVGAPQVTTCAAWPFGGSNIATAGKSMLTYDAPSDVYTIAWKTSKSWVNSCRTVAVTFDDGSYRIANVTLTK